MERKQRKIFEYLSETFLKKHLKYFNYDFWICSLIHKKIQILDFYQGDGETSIEIHKKKKNSIIEYILP
jgi:hypothetical protein